MGYGNYPTTEKKKKKKNNILEKKYSTCITQISNPPPPPPPLETGTTTPLIVMGLADRQDREIIASSAKHDLRILDTEIQTLDQGEAIISTIGIPFPVSCHIHHFEEYLNWYS